jgi:hypothetical protein
MVKIDSTQFGSITINGKRYDHDILITPEGKIEPLETRIRHVFSEVEFELLAKDKPEIIIIGNGQYSCLEIEEKVKNLAKKNRIELIILPTPQAIKKFNELSKRKISAYMHVTC